MHTSCALHECYACYAECQREDTTRIAYSCALQTQKLFLLSHHANTLVLTQLARKSAYFLVWSWRVLTCMNTKTTKKTTENEMKRHRAIWNNSKNDDIKRRKTKWNDTTKCVGAFHRIQTKLLSVWDSCILYSISSCVGGATTLRGVWVYWLSFVFMHVSHMYMYMCILFSRISKFVSPLPLVCGRIVAQGQESLIE
jgi:hypothetical protein